MSEEDDFPGGWEPYGVCDSPEQFARRFPKYKGNVWFTVVKRVDQPEEGGWRWRKWGDYVGEYAIDGSYSPHYLSECDGSNEYPVIDEQWLFYLEKDRDNEVQKISNVLGLPLLKKYTIADGKAIETNDKLNDFAGQLSGLMALQNLGLI